MKKGTDPSLHPIILPNFPHKGWAESDVSPWRCRRDEVFHILSNELGCRELISVFCDKGLNCLFYLYANVVPKIGDTIIGLVVNEVLMYGQKIRATYQAHPCTLLCHTVFSPSKFKVNRLLNILDR